MEHPDLTSAFNTYRNNPQCGYTVWGIKKTETKETRGSLKLLRDIALLPLGWPRSSKQFDVFNALRNVLVS